MADSGRRVRAELDVAVVARPQSGVAPPRAVSGVAVLYEDGGWVLRVDGWPPLRSEDATARQVVTVLWAGTQGSAA